MIIYNRQSLEALEISRTAKQWLTGGIISDAQYAAIKTKYATNLYVPNLFVRIALFIFTFIAFAGIYGMIVLTNGIRHVDSVHVLVGLMSLVGLEFAVKWKNLYKSGIDESLLYCSLFLCISGLITMYSDAAGSSSVTITHWMLALPFLLWGVARYADVVSAASVFICLLGIVFTPLLQMGAIAMSFLPFVAMTIAVAMFFASRRLKELQSLRSYEDCFWLIELLSLVLFYCAGNYFVVQKTYALLLQENMIDSPAVPSGWLFGVLTAITPIAFIAGGLKVRDHLLLRMGLITAVLSILTFRFYFHVLPPETALMIAGMVLFGIGVIAMRALKSSPGGFTDKNLLNEKLVGLDSEAIAIAMSFGASPQPHTPDTNFESGGGAFGGGGANAEW